MPMWRCPHCGTPQAETARCWVCRRSSTACGNCRNYRSSVAGSLGYCGLDRKREPLAGDEIRACWEARPGVAYLTVIAPLAVQPGTDDAAATGAAVHREFIEVTGTGPGAVAAAAVPAGEPAGGAGDLAAPLDGPTPGLIQPAGERGWSLWGDVDR